MFDRVDAPVAVDDLEYCGVTVPTDDGHVPMDEYHSDSSTGDHPDDQNVDTSEHVMIGDDGPADGSGIAPAEETDASSVSV